MSQSGSVNIGPAPTFWETDGSEPKDVRAPELEPGETLGRYVVLYRLGTGGMGIVYAAYDPQLDRKVALKMLRRASSNPERRKRMTERLLSEARAMARLTHPNVITVHDVAVMGGRIFVAMEFIDGVTLTRHLAGGEHDWRKVLDILLAAGKGLAAAHEAGLVHRDFKPDNVMLARDGRTLVMDFGLARALDPDDGGSLRGGSPRPRTSGSDASDSGVLALPGADGKPVSRVAGTPGYMAPEQHRGKLTDARTDQFSFCVTMYESLYRQRPFKGDSPDEIADEIEAERITDPPPAPPVPGWVHTIMLRGMRARPEDRWDSMAALLAALNNDPAVHRRRWMVRGGVAALLGGAVAVGAFVGLGDDGLCEGGDERLAGVWDKEQRTRVSAAFAGVDRPYARDALLGTIEGLDRYAADWVEMHRETCEANRVRGEQSDDLFDLRMDCLERRHSELRALSELFAEADHDVVKESVMATAKLTSLEACADVQLLKSTVPVPDDPKVRSKVSRIREDLARAKAYEDGGRYQRALELVQGVMDEARSLDYPPVLAEALTRRGDVQLQTGALEDAEASLREALRHAATGRHDELAAKAWIRLATVLSQAGQIERSAEAVETAATAVLRAGELPDLAAELANTQGMVLFAQGNFPKAQIAFEQALGMQQRLLGDNHPKVARFYNNVALAYGQQGNLEESIRYLRRAVALEEQVLGSVHPRVAAFVGNLGAMELQRGNLEVAEKEIRRALEILARQTAEAPRLGLMTSNLGETRMMAGDIDGAVSHFRRAIKQQESSLGPTHPDLGLTLTNLAGAQTMQGHAKDALETLDRAATIFTASGTEHPTYAHVLANRGEAELLLGRYEQAIEHFEGALERLEKTPGLAVYTDLAWLKFGLARALVEVGREPGRARELAKAALIEIDSKPSVPLRKLWAERIRAWNDTHAADLDAPGQPLMRD